MGLGNGKLLYDDKVLGIPLLILLYIHTTYALCIVYHFLKGPTIIQISIIWKNDKLALLGYSIILATK